MKSACRHDIKLFRTLQLALPKGAHLVQNVARVTFVLGDLKCNQVENIEL